MLFAAQPTLRGSARSSAGCVTGGRVLRARFPRPDVGVLGSRQLSRRGTGGLVAQESWLDSRISASVTQRPRRLVTFDACSRHGPTRSCTGRGLGSESVSAPRKRPGKYNLPRKRRTWRSGPTRGQNGGMAVEGGPEACRGAPQMQVGARFGAGNRGSSLCVHPEKCCSGVEEVEDEGEGEGEVGPPSVTESDESGSGYIRIVYLDLDNNRIRPPKPRTQRSTW